MSFWREPGGNDPVGTEPASLVITAKVRRYVRAYGCVATIYERCFEIGFLKMILFDLECGTGHGFEAWFKDSAAYASQHKGKAIACPACGSTDVKKALMAPNIAPSRGLKRAKEGEAAVAKTLTYYQAVKALHKEVADKCDDVGERFAEEARRIHTGEAEKRGIVGKATVKDAIELKEEGIECHPLPELPHTDA